MSPTFPPPTGLNRRRNTRGINTQVGKNPVLWLDPYYDNAAYSSKSAAIQAAVTAAGATNRALALRGNRTYVLDTAPLKIFANSPLTIFANGATFQSQWGWPGCIVFTRAADYDTFENLRIYGTLFLDANNITPATTSCVFGNLGNNVSTAFQRVNFQDIYCEDLRIINLPTVQGSGVTHGVSLWSRHISPHETQTSSTQVRIRANVQGGNYGCDSLGSGGSRVDTCGTTNTSALVTDPSILAADLGTGVTGTGVQAGTTVIAPIVPGVSFTMSQPATATNASVSLTLAPTFINHFFDTNFWDITHDSFVDFGNVTNIGGGNQFGGAGFGGRIEVHIDERNAGDVGLEIDSFQKADVWGEVYNPRNMGFLAMNFNPGMEITTQRYVYHAPRVEVPSTRVTGGTSPQQAIAAGWNVGGASSSGVPFGEVVLEDPVYLGNMATLNCPLGQALVVPVTNSVRAVTITGNFLVSYPNLADTNAAAIMKTIYLNPVGSRFTLRGGSIRVSTAGTIASGGQQHFLMLSPKTGCVARVQLDDVTFDPGATGGAAGSTYGLELGTSTTDGGHVRGTISRLGWGVYGAASDTTPNLLLVRPSSEMTIDGSVKINHMDLSQDPNASAAIISGGAPDTTNRTRLHVGRCDYPGVYMYSSTSGLFSSANFTTAAANTYTGNLSATVYAVAASGAGITLITVSRDGGTTQNTVLSQSAGAISASGLAFEIENGDQITVTFTTTQPTFMIARHRTGL